MYIKQIDGQMTLFGIAEKDIKEGTFHAPPEIIIIGMYAFQDWIELINIILPDSVTFIGNGAFSRCRNLKGIILPAGVTSIGSGVFSGCSSLVSIILPAGVTSIGYGAFSGCSSLDSIIFPAGVTSIGSWAFSKCSSLTSITLPTSVTSIGLDAFFECDNLTNILIDTDDPEEFERIKKLLPTKLQDFATSPRVQRIKNASLERFCLNCPSIGLQGLDEVDKDSKGIITLMSAAPHVMEFYNLMDSITVPSSRDDYIRYERALDQLMSARISWYKLYFFESKLNVYLKIIKELIPPEFLSGGEVKNVSNQEIIRTYNLITTILRHFEVNFDDNFKLTKQDMELITKRKELSKIISIGSQEALSLSQGKNKTNRVQIGFFAQDSDSDSEQENENLDYCVMKLKTG